MFVRVCTLLLFFLSSNTLLVGGLREQKTEKIPETYQFVPESVLISDPGSFRKAALIWPDKKNIREKECLSSNKKVSTAIESSLIWLEKVVKPEWIPRQSQLKIFALKTDVLGSDAIRFRYQMGNYLFQVTNTYSVIAIAIKEKNSSKDIRKITVNEAKAFISSSFVKFFNHADTLGNFLFYRVSELKNGTVKAVPANSAGNAWCQLNTWWTDGKTILLIAVKTEAGRSSLGLEKKIWFSEK